MVSLGGADEKKSAFFRDSSSLIKDPDDDGGACTRMSMLTLFQAIEEVSINPSRYRLATYRSVMHYPARLSTLNSVLHSLAFR